MVIRVQIDPASDTPIYRQLYDHIRELIASGRLAKGDRLPPTRELAGSLGLNRTTVSAAYNLLEETGLIEGHVGRGSFVAGTAASADPAPPDETISFATSRPLGDLFPLNEFRATAEEVIASREIANILQLGSPYGYAPLRHYLLDRAQQENLAGSDNEVVITNGCQQALDLIQRVLLRPGDAVAVEDPVYPGLKNLFEHAGARLIGVPVTQDGMDLDVLERVLDRETPKLLVVTPNFQNPTGASLSTASRERLLRIAGGGRTTIIENDTYGDLRYVGEPIPNLKQMDGGANVVLLRTFSKVSFPGLRVGWATGPRPLMARLAEAKQWTDLHSDHLSQAVMLRFAESGRLEAHRRRMLCTGAQQLQSALAGCERFMPPGTSWTKPQGGMNMWVRLPGVVDPVALLERAQREKVSYLPGRFFEVSRPSPSALRLSFGALAPDRISAGLAILGRIFKEETERARAVQPFDPAPAMV